MSQAAHDAPLPDPQPQTAPWTLSRWWEEASSSRNTLVSRGPLPDTRCAECERAFAVDEQKSSLSHSVVLKVANASPDTCWQCRILTTLAERKVKRRLGMDEELEIWSSAEAFPKISTFRVREGSKLSTGDEDEHRIMTFTSLDTLPCPWNTFDDRKHTPSAVHILDSHSYDVASYWLKDCLANHPECHSSEETLLPRRVIRIGENYTDIRLVQHDSPTLGQYNCLSHCWGGAQPLITTTHNIAQHLERIEWNSIPKTFQDAIKFTAHLGISYIWIDSLCIIQDSAHDWAEESAKMCSIYENGHLTIAATAASNGTGGLPVRESSNFVRLTGITSGTESKPFEILAYFELGLGEHPFPTNYRTPSLSRGWVHQEMILSPRVIHFAKKELLWECKTGGTCQCPQPPPFRSTFFKQAHYQALLHPSPEKSLLLTRQWHTIIESYSRLKLSFAGDKFPALSGLAQQMSKTRGPEVRYLAGLWSDSLLTDLLWTAAYVWSLHAIDRILQANEWRAPSWSWAARDVPVIFPRLGTERNGSTCEVKPLCDIIAAETTLATTDRTGRISDGRLVVKGELFYATLYRDIERPGPDSKSGKGETKATVTLTITTPMDPATGVKTFTSYASERGSSFVLMTQSDAKGLKEGSKPDDLGTLIKEGFNPDSMAELLSVERTDGREYMGSDIRVLRMARVGRRMPPPDETRWLVDTEYSLVLARVDNEPMTTEGDKTTKTYRRIGIIHEGREGYKGVEDARDDFWKRYPSCLERGGREETVVIV
ncbi:heterokaryon incompatibility protein-domain-containing protein [Sordaria brevicollis]|uniref:Heterokaryon incompatibility protein-domain-containing protein n=1 Tax=Sordaria brevicollis TaxID=83679 RepID=A0AAE0NRC7_SORBR|nr:heterokaryon incompatibility protein-domain-containing protein [Sordaria brevicollis]